MGKTTTFSSALQSGVFRPQELISHFGIEQGMQVADFGSGAGDFAILLAKIVGKEGRVSAIDIKEGAVQSVQSRAKFFGLNNITVTRSDLETQNGSKLPDASQDRVVCTNILFQSKKKEEIAREALRVLRPQGHCIVVEWKNNVALGPHATVRMSREEIVDLMEKQGFKLTDEFQAGGFHFGLIFTRN